MSHTHTTGEAMKVVLVDEMASYRLRLRSYLQICLPPVEIIGETGDGMEALVLVDRLRPDVVILDIQLGRYEGLKLLSQLRAGCWLPVVIVLTHLVDREYHVTCLERGADFFFDKTFDIDILEEVLRSLQSRFADERFANEVRA